MEVGRQGPIHASGLESRHFLVEITQNLWVTFSKREALHKEWALLPCPEPTKRANPFTPGFLVVSHEGVQW